MSTVTAWILSVTAAAVLAAIVRNLMGKGSIGILVQYLSSIFLLLTILSPLVKLELPNMERWFEDFRCEGEAAAEEGRQMALNETRELIKTRVEAYILDKAAVYGVSPSVDVQIDDSGIPCIATIQGRMPPVVKDRLEQILETELGIGKEEQHWIE